MTTPKVTTAGVLQRVGVNNAAVLSMLDMVAGDAETTTIYDYITMAQHGEMMPVYERKKLLRETLSLLSLSSKRNVVLVGEEGVGRKTLVQSLALLAAEDKLHGVRSVVMMNEVALLENPLQTLRVALRRASGGILLVPHLERFFGSRATAAFPQQVCRDLHKAILNEDQVVIGTVTPPVFDELMQEKIVRQNMNRLDVPAPSKKEAVEMLSYHHGRLEQDYELMVTEDSLETAVNMASQYIKNGSLPASALQIAERACALVRLVGQGHELQLVDDGRVDAEDVMVAASQITKIPMTKLSEDEQGKYANMVGHLQQRIIGQEEAVTAVSRAVKVARVGLRSPKRPIGSFMFLGPSGVGKSELAKALAEFMFGSEDKMLVLDMSEYQESSSLNRLIGSPRGYIGSAEGGQLTNFVRENPYTVVLFDEVEKAHQRVFDVLLQVMDEGRLTDGMGRTAAFSETVVIMTSNLGARHMLVPEIGEMERELVMNDVHTFFRPEFLNRVDDVIMFHQLSPDQLSLIMDLMLKKEIKLAAQQGLDLAVTPAGKEWLLAQNDQPEYGARPLRRIIARHLREPLADHLLSSGAKVGAGTAVIVDGNEEGLQFSVVGNA
ncbi:MAG: AAA domain-containing protein [Sphaerospermopsis sp. SIO1G2]|nr:AAA domain-containing protein [Sphaerospermopsis sp. SIO1G2]